MKWTKSFGFAFAGWRKAWSGQSNLRIHCWALAGVVALGLYFKLHPWEWCVILLATTMVIALELINTALETLTDMITREQNPLAGTVKDISAAAVLVAAVSSIIIGIIIFGKYFFRLVEL